MSITINIGAVAGVVTGVVWLQVEVFARSWLLTHTRDGFARRRAAEVRRMRSRRKVALVLALIAVMSVTDWLVCVLLVLFVCLHTLLVFQRTCECCMWISYHLD